MFLVATLAVLAVALVPPVAGRLTGNRRPSGSVGLDVVGPGASGGGGNPSPGVGGTPALDDTPTPPPTTDLSAPPPGDDISTTPPTIDLSTILATVSPPDKGGSRVLAFGRDGSGALALTFDDGHCADCVTALVEAVERTGAHVTLCPNGVYGPMAWNRSADRIKALIGTGHVGICNHTWSHKDLTKLSEAEVRDELTRNEEWIEATFGVSSRPFFRPPFGKHNDTVDRIAAELGFTKVLMWSGPLGDSYSHSPEVLLDNMRTYAKAGGVILAHANHPVTAELFDELVRITQEAGLTPVTVSELFGIP